MEAEKPVQKGSESDLRLVAFLNIEIKKKKKK